MKKYLLLSVILVGALMGCSTSKKAVTGQSQKKSIVILYENDVHGQIDGYPKLAGLRDAISQSDTAWTAVVSNGDYLSGGVACSLNKGMYIATLMNSVGYDAVTLGNHEYDFGMPRLLELLPTLNTTPVCVNLYEYQGTKPMMAPYIIKMYGDKRVAFVGISTPESMESEAYAFFDEKGKQLYDLHTDEAYSMVQNAVDEARGKGADYVVVLAHLGEENEECGIGSYGLVAATRGIDVVLDGHTHHVLPRKEIANLDGKMVPISQTGTQFANYGKLVITKDGKFYTTLVPAAENMYSSEKVAATLADVKAKINEQTSRQLCRSDFELTINDDNGERRVRNGETNLGDLVADAYRYITKAEIGLTNGGGLRNSINAGLITYGDVLNTLPFENYMIKMEATGQQIMTMLEECTSQYPKEDGCFPHVSGMRYTVHGKSHKVTDVEVHDPATNEYKSLDLQRRYTIGTIDYTLKGHIMHDCPQLPTESLLYSECVAKYLESFAGGVVSDDYAKPQGRITIVED